MTVTVENAYEYSNNYDLGISFSLNSLQLFQYVCSFTTPCSDAESETTNRG
jgi:hypothetical protein